MNGKPLYTRATTFNTDICHVLYSYYYQKSCDRVSTHPVTIHALLHIAGGIEAMGPVWTYWAFPMKCFCGKLLHCIKIHHHPFANIDSYVTAVAQLDQIKNHYNAHKDLALLPPNKESSWEFRIEECNFFLYILAQGLSVLIVLIDPTSVLCFPHQKIPPSQKGSSQKSL